MKKLGFGTMRLPLINHDDPKSIDYEQVNRMVDHFMEQGFTYFDTAYPYHEEVSELAVKKCLVERYPRDSFLLADKMPVFRIKNSDEYETYFQEQLTKCGVTYFDYYLLHNLGTDRYALTEKLGGFSFLTALKEKGLAKQVGFSYHDNAELLDQILTEHPEVDFVQLQINYLDWDSALIQSRLCYETAVKHGKKVIVMEPIKGGMLANLPSEALNILENAQSEKTPASYAVRYAASLEHVLVVLSGMSNMEQLLDNTSYMKEFEPLNVEEQKLVTEVADIINRVIKIPCTSCKYCMEVCPKNINIPAYFALYNAYQITKSKTNMYYQRAAQEHGKASDCIKCGRCEGNCPQHIEIRKELEKFVELYEKE